MRRILFLLAGVSILGFLGWQVREAEALIASGDRILLELAPVDPRSLMQGDYMRLAYAMERSADVGEAIAGDPAPIAVLAVDGRGIATFRRFAAEATPGPGEKPFRVRHDMRAGRIVVEPHSYLFQEGRADDFAKARYGIFAVTPEGRHLLIGLADAEGRRIEPK